MLFHLQLQIKLKVMNLDDNVISRTTKTEKIFNFSQGNCAYQNIESFRKKKENQQGHQVKIFNTICKENQKRLVKHTEIQFRGKIITIEDIYCFQHQPNSDAFSADRSTALTGSSDGSQKNHEGKSFPNDSTFPKKKKLIFKKNIIGGKSSYQILKRNTKNIAKNFCRAFVTYLQERGQQATFLKTKSMISEYKFNNKTIEKLATDEMVKQHFKEFLVTKADQWINSSKISDKEIHKQAIKLYLQLVQKAVDRIADSQQLYVSDSNQIYHSNQVNSEQDNGVGRINERNERSQH